MNIADLKGCIEYISQADEAALVPKCIGLFETAYISLVLRDGPVRDKPGILASMITAGVVYLRSDEGLGEETPARKKAHRDLYEKVRAALGSQSLPVNLPIFEDLSLFVPAPPEDPHARRRRLAQKWGCPESHL